MHKQTLCAPPPDTHTYTQIHTLTHTHPHALLIISALSSFLLSASLPLSDAWKQTQQTSRMPARQGILGNPGRTKAGGERNRESRTRTTLTVKICSPQCWWLGDGKDTEGGQGNSERGEVERRRMRECRQPAFISALIKPCSRLT